MIRGLCYFTNRIWTPGMSPVLLCKGTKVLSLSFANFWPSSCTVHLVFKFAPVAASQSGSGLIWNVPDALMAQGYKRNEKEDHCQIS